LANNSFTRWIEGNGIHLRKYLNLSPVDILDPFKLAYAMGVHVVSAKDAELPKEAITQLLLKDRKNWDAGCIRLPENAALILYNPYHSPTRIRATIMEELSHLHLNHKGSILSNIDQICCRSYKKSEEKQAYAVGAAALIPMSMLNNAKRLGISKRSLAIQCMVSLELVTYRENVTGIKLY
jgi:Zn-dependent peptidase ImmA (M78 family)